MKDNQVGCLLIFHNFSIHDFANIISIGQQIYSNKYLFQQNYSSVMDRSGS